MTPSPCIGVCELAPYSVICAGCHRTLSEIASWHRFTEEEKEKVLEVIRERRRTHENKSPGAPSP